METLITCLLSMRKCDKMSAIVVVLGKNLLFFQVKFWDCWALMEQEKAPSCICCLVTLTPLQARLVHIIPRLTSFFLYC